MFIRKNCFVSDRWQEIQQWFLWIKGHIQLDTKSRARATKPASINASFQGVPGRISSCWWPWWCCRLSPSSGREPSRSSTSGHALGGRWRNSASTAASSRPLALLVSQLCNHRNPHSNARQGLWHRGRVYASWLRDQGFLSHRLLFFPLSTFGTLNSSLT